MPKCDCIIKYLIQFQKSSPTLHEACNECLTMELHTVLCIIPCFNQT